MTYPGGKAQSGTYQQIINLIPPHRVYIETHLGGGAIARAKRPAAVNILIDLDAAAIAAFGDAISPAAARASDGDTAIIDDTCRHPSPNPAMLASPTANGDAPATPYWPLRATSSLLPTPSFHLLNTDALAFLRTYPFQGDEFIYCDPPYLMTTRRQHRPIYRYELSEADHVALLACLLSLPCKVMISGYWSQLYADALAGDASGLPEGRWHTHTFEAVTRGGSMATEWLWMNYARPVALHQYDYLGSGFRERERIKRKKTRWVERLRKMPALEKQAILAAIEELEGDYRLDTEAQLLVRGTAIETFKTALENKPAFRRGSYSANAPSTAGTS